MSDLTSLKQSTLHHLVELAELYSLDWQQLEELREARESGDITERDFETLEEMERLISAHGAEDEEQAGDCLYTVPLEFTCSVSKVNLDDWPPACPDTLEILLSTGGPASRIVCELDETKWGAAVNDFRVEVQDWGTMWERVPLTQSERVQISALVEFWTDSGLFDRFRK
jgi:hypothetical protein